jgi:hypothetical protein
MKTFNCKQIQKIIIPTDQILEIVCILKIGSKIKGKLISANKDPTLDNAYNLYGDLFCRILLIQNCIKEEVVDKITAPTPTETLSNNKIRQAGLFSGSGFQNESGKIGNKKIVNRINAKCNIT